MLLLFWFPAAPSAPTGPIKIKEVTADSVTFDWQTPKEDGGLPISAFNIFKSENDGDWVKLDTVDQRTTSYKAKNLTEGNRYNFRVVAVNKIGEGKPLDSDTTVTKKPAGKIFGPSQVKIAQNVQIQIHLMHVQSLIQAFAIH